MVANVQAPARSQGAIASPSRRGGFSLIELLVVLALIVILGAIGVPFALETIRRTTFVSAADCTANLLRVARLQAIRQNAEIEVTVEGRTLVVATGQDHPPSCQLPAVVDTVAVDGWMVNGGEPLFRSNGTALEDGAFRFADRRGNRLEVRLAPAAVGRIEVRKFDGLNWVGRDQGGWQWL